MNRPPYLNPFILDVTPVAPVALSGHADLYLPQGTGPFPVVLLVHGMLLEPAEVSPREWPVFQGYAAALAGRGVAAVVVEHDLARGPHFPEALQTVLSAADQAAVRPEVDANRVGAWVLSAGGPLALGLMASYADRFRAFALTYPLLESAHLPDWPSAEAALAGLGDRGLVITTVEHEIPDFVPAQESFLDAARSAGAAVEHLHVEGAQHGFESLDPTNEGREGVVRAVEAVVALLRRPSRFRYG